MTAKQSRELLPGTVVMQDGDKNDLGTVRRVTDRGVFIDWANDRLRWTAHEDMGGIKIR